MSNVSLEGRKTSSSNSIPQKPSAPVVSRFTGNRSVSKPIPSRPNGLKPVQSQNGDAVKSGYAPIPLASRPIKRPLKNSSIGSRGSQTSDAEHTSTSTLSGFTPNLVRRRIESDLSTAPLSSETSDMETSGNEKMECGTKDRVPARPPPPPKAAAIRPAIGRNNVAPSGGKVAPQSRPPVSRKPESVYATRQAPSLSSAERRVASTVAAHGDSSASSPEISQPQRRVQPVAPGPLTKTVKTVPPKPGANIPSKPSKPPVPPKSKPEVRSKPVPPTQQKQQDSNQQEKDKQAPQREKDKQPLPQQEKLLQDKQQKNGHKSVKDHQQQLSRSSTPTGSVKKGKDTVSQKDIKDAILKKSSVSGIQRRGSSPVTSRTPSVTLRPQRSYSAKTASHRLSTPNLTVDPNSLKGSVAARPGSSKNSDKTPSTSTGSKSVSKAVLQRFSVNLTTDGDKLESSLKSGIRKQPSAANKRSDLHHHLRDLPYLPLKLLVKPASQQALFQ